MNEFIREYRNFREWPDEPVFVYIDAELTPLYPIALYRMGDTLVIGITDMLKGAKQSLSELPPSATVDEIISILFEGVKYKLDGSAFYVLPQDTRVDTGAGEIIPLTKAHKRDMKKLLSACTKRERDVGQVGLTDPCVVGCFSNGELVAAASFWYWGDKIADIGVIVHPEHRGKGFGKSAVSALIKEGQNLGKWPLYRCDDWNTASIALCKSLGFEKLFPVEGAIVEYPKD